MHIGLFGGTFNPIHSGHIHASQEVKKAFSLDKIYLIPSALPPHKKQNGIAEAKYRLEMVRLSISTDSSLYISDVELKRSGPSYTIDTVLHFKSILPKNDHLYLILGLDAFLEIDTWKSYKDLFLLASFIVMARPGVTYHRISYKWNRLENYLKSKISQDYRFSVVKSGYIHDEKQTIYRFNTDFLDISSTNIRRRLKTGRSIRSLISKEVEDYIKTKGLYR
ncbi:MAG: nicotinate-nucleotide adenylyltransferase [Desulfobacterales bacterium]|jgi:nicotinate-nucleotide adenylyltransferase|nr:nicotinate (nicotinamide) nucleotide adenylyltransferase [Desulfobacter sp.]MDP6393915.1 nicotinate-nucleotide adenylyltransferase [Desulfobacterales bacterium]MDP6683299.1 nicotinate-nucleotide adenylyltransferase [Desulfobacterales bacterium]MDP6808581.1 nicotinate-nucleotide adenylyltransferase [Desulfobacterales bacterium]|tara:strand:- start:32030 stop:32695 length:666 start_codon:yes stop_codon:yes gene_type:complete